jgi:pimeloyl-ACP methyl ester carboxylesterase
MRINGHELNVEFSGPENGPVVVLLHHGLGSTWAWKAQIPALVAAGWRVIAYDRWGYGASCPRPQLSIPSFEEDVQDLLGLLDCLELERPVIVGHSDGGTIGLRFAADYPERLSALVVVAAHAYVEPKMKTGMRQVRQTYEQEPRFLGGLQRLHGEKTSAVFEGWFHGWFRQENLEWDMQPMLGRIACPTLVIQGEADEYATPQHAIDIAAAIRGAQLWLEPGAGHMLPQEVPEEFNRRLVGFLDEVKE